MQPAFTDYQMLIQTALTEDIGRGDLTGSLLLAPDATASLQMVAREEIVLAGLMLAMQVFQGLDPEVTVEPLSYDSQKVAKGEAFLKVSGNAQAIMAAERTALNFVQRLSSVATLTHRYVEAVKGTGATILDTRKTLPGYRELDKYAVRAGGGRNHRFRLDDGILIKDNHIALCGGVKEAVELAQAAAPAMIKIEVECDTLEQVSEALASGADVIMLDNMTNAQLVEAVAMREALGTGIKLEASGNVNLETVRSIAETGVDFISVGRITHSAPCVDIGLDVGINA